ncbi:MAG: DUF2975 domain-containing protein [Candidatus Nucleicultricaceae bacterium]
MQRIQKMSTFFFYLFTVLLIASPITSVLFWLFLNDIPFKLLEPHFGFSVSWKVPGAGIVEIKDKIPMILSHRLVALAGTIFAHIPLYFGYAALRRLFGLYRSKIIFSAQNVQCYRMLGMLMIGASGFFMPIGEGITVMALSLSNPPGERLLSIGFGSPGIEMILTGLMIIVISWIMDEGRKIEEDRDLIV